ncbi:MAG: hypothetical protein WD335_03505 [Candidatus Paceibacterota bacterium]
MLILTCLSFSLSGCSESPPPAPPEADLHQMANEWFGENVAGDSSFEFRTFQVRNAVHEKGDRNKLAILAHVVIPNDRGPHDAGPALFIYRVNDNGEWEVEGSLQMKIWPR